MLSNFYIETVIHFFFNSEKYFFFDRKKNKKSHFLKISFFFGQNFWMSGVFIEKYFWRKKKLRFFFETRKKYIFSDLIFFFEKKIRCRKFIRFDLWNFQSGSGTLLRARCKYVPSKLQQSDHFRYLSATRPLAILRSSPPLTNFELRFLQEYWSRQFKTSGSFSYDVLG